MKVGDFKFADLAFPLGVQQGTDASFEFVDSNLAADVRAAGKLATTDGIVQDTLTAVRNMTRRDTFIDAAQMMDLLMFLPVAALAEREHFRRPEAAGDAKAAFRALTDRKGGAMMTPYRNVVRLHLLIFFFAAAHVLKLESFLVYAVVYAVYFFPWRLVKRDKV